MSLQAVSLLGNVSNVGTARTSTSRTSRRSPALRPSSTFLPRFSVTDDHPCSRRRSSSSPSSRPLTSRVTTTCSSSRSGNSATADPSTAPHAGSEDDPSCSSASASFADADMQRTASTLYDLLGISQTGSQADIKGAYRQLARRFHPDVRPAGLSEEECTRRFIRVQEAYEILSDPQRRAMYDFEMMHGRRGRRMGVPAHAKATWRPRRRSEEEPPLWATFEDEADVKASWRSQWNRQMDGLRSHRGTQPKPGAWAAQMRAHQEEEQQRHEERLEQQAQYEAQSQSFYDSFCTQDEDCEAPCA